MVMGPIQIHPNEDIKFFNKHQVSDYLYSILLSMLLYRILTTNQHSLSYAGPDVCNSLTDEI